MAPKLDFSPISRPEHACGDCGKERLPFNRKKPLAESDSGRVAIRLDQLGFEKTEKRGEKNTIQRISVGTGKHELITTIMSHVHNII